MASDEIEDLKRRGLQWMLALGLAQRKDSVAYKPSIQVPDDVSITEDNTEEVYVGPTPTIAPPQICDEDLEWIRGNEVE